MSDNKHNAKGSKYRPHSRDYTFEALLYFLEKGPKGMLICDVLFTYVIWSILPFIPKSSIITGLLSFIVIAILIPLIIVFIYSAVLIIKAYQTSLIQWENNTSHMPDWTNSNKTGVIFKNDSIMKPYLNKKIPIETAIELYFNEKISFNNTKEVFLNRYDLFTFTFTWNHVKWFIFTFLAQLTGHTVEKDAREVGDVYNRGNDFYGWFLGESMVYTSGIYHEQKYGAESLEEAQYRKIHTILDSIHLQKGETLLDIGCGWGTLVIEAAKKYGANAIGCTLAKEQVVFAKKRAKENGVEGLCNWVIDDYRKIPEHTNQKKFDKITCIEMAEHVGIKNFTPFLKQVRSMLKDDGIFYIQMAGVRRTWSFEDLVWILFMGKYIFPGADASTAVNWVINQLERNGFEIHRVENCGVHYARTIEQWHDNWVSNKKEILESKYGIWWYRLWDVFLAWSCMIARQGTSAVYMMTVTKNLICDQHSINVRENNQPTLNRTKLFIGDKPVAYQQ